jgi:hypothetical protein
MGAAPLLTTALAVVLASTTGCKKSPSYDRSTPDKTLASFFKALADERIPEDLDRLVIAEGAEATVWKVRCEAYGCTGGSYRIVERGPASDYEATLLIDYRITGERGAVVMQGQRSPVQLLREPDGWRITQLGKTTRHVSHPAAPPVQATDAGPP